ncbi:MAG: ribonuclease R [Acidobacteria bacterium]|uniref:Ribonuclease R n=1 Tax=Candidatus Polarisedimenticola svalbardensis TaxID=2886004 RepID=A0A8J6XV75_9BACT|nr:ribonuclease R [Candidatus Polarisedimenticola svalbardensis]
MSKPTLEEQILAFVESDGYEPAAQRHLFHALNIPNDDRPAARRVIRAMIEEGRLMKLSRGRLTAPARPNLLEGLLKRHPRGFGFVVAEDGGEDVFIPPPFIGSRITGDRVEAEVTRETEGGRREGRIVRTIQGRSREVLGVYRKRGKSGVVQPFDHSLGDAIEVTATPRSRPADGQVVVVKLRRPGKGRSPAEGEIIERLGHLDNPSTDTEIVIRRFGLADGFPAAILEEAGRLPSEISTKEAGHRERFDDPAPVTIDGETARDFDDAIAVSRIKGGGFRLWVHIADVAHFVTPGSPLDREARERGTSVYFPDKVLPMFPERLSNDLCSLRPDVDRLVQTAVIDLGPKGDVKKVRFADGVIHSAARLTYIQVAELLEGASAVKGIPVEVVPMLKTAGELREVLERRRHARGSVDFDLPEPHILMDIEGVMTGITVTPRNEAHRLIEEFMLLANEVVAGHLEKIEWPCMYRIHEKPKPEKLDTLASFVKQFGLELKLPKGEVTPGAIGDLLEQVEGKPEHNLISQVALRSMRQARYHPKNDGHFGLGAPVYCHFTSPIRRYPDLVVHRLLRASRNDRKRIPEWAADLEPVATSSSELERNAEAAERDLLLRKKLAFIEGQIGERLWGIITGVVPFGVFIQLEDSLAEGLLRLGGDDRERFAFDADHLTLTGSKTGKRFRLGDRLEVVVAAVDPVLQRVDFEL